MKITVTPESTLNIKIGDITLENTDAIVNAANEQLQHSGGVARAIAKRAGENLEKESRIIGYVKTGEAVITTGGNLSTKYVIHAVGPIYKGGEAGENKLLSSAVTNSLNLADNYQIKSISFPAISTGIYGYPIRDAARIIILSIYNYLKHENTSITDIRIVLFSNSDYSIFEKNLLKIID